jgi:hypothetical protein
VSVLLPAKFCAEIGVKYRTKPSARMPAIAIKIFFNTIITTLSYNRIASIMHIREKISQTTFIQQN